MELERLGGQSGRCEEDGGEGTGRCGAGPRPPLREALVTVGRRIVREGHGPMPLWEFSRRLADHLGSPPVPLDEWSQAVKETLREVNDPGLRVLAPQAPGAGYVYDAADPDTWPVRR